MEIAAKLHFWYAPGERYSPQRALSNRGATRKLQVLVGGDLLMRLPHRGQRQMRATAADLNDLRVYTRVSVNNFSYTLSIMF